MLRLHWLCSGLVESLFIILPSLAISATPTTAGKLKDPQSVSSDSEHLIEPPLPRWELLDFYTVVNRPSLAHRIRRIKVILPEKQATPWQAGWTADKPILYETDDPGALKAIETYLTRPLRIAVARGVHGARGDGSSSSLGAVKIITNTEEFDIHISRVGFVLESDSADYQNTFYSWGLAQFLDDVTFLQLKTHVPAAIMKELTGEARMDSDKNAMDARRKATEDMKK